MRAIILAAGVGRRMAPVTDSMPKCLMPFGGRSLLAWYLDGLQSVGITNASIVVGYRKEQIMEEATVVAPSMSIRWVINEEFRRGSIYSLWVARTECDDDVLVMDADVLFPRVFLTRLLESAHPNAVLVDQHVTQRDEERMVMVREGRVVALTKTPPVGAVSHGEGVGFLKIAASHTECIGETLNPYISSGNLDIEYEDALGEFFERVDVGYEEIGDMSWIEIDCVADRDRAQADVLPGIIRLDEAHDVSVL
ncbi:MAG TPA: phosphocholine cytidylyltransferase family protein [Nitrospirales bacterium]|nr:phosphocholine cytidylyltransferase family protein [Nitrospirales bacterium]